jgi:hypothetical protein
LSTILSSFGGDLRYWIQLVKSVHVYSHSSTLNGSKEKVTEKTKMGAGEINLEILDIAHGAGPTVNQLS